MQKASVLQALLQFVRFGLPWDFRTTITIARGGGALRRTFRHSSPATRPRRGLAVLGRRSFSQRQAGDPVLRRRQSSIKSRGVLDRRSEPGDGSANRETAHGRRATTRPRPSPVQGNAQRQRGHVAIRSAMSGKGMPAIPRPQENEGVGEHVRTRFHFDREATREIAEPKESAPHRTKKTRFFCRTVKRTIRPLT